MTTTAACCTDRPTKYNKNMTLSANSDKILLPVFQGQMILSTWVNEDLNKVQDPQTEHPNYILPDDTDKRPYFGPSSMAYRDSVMLICHSCDTGQVYLNKRFFVIFYLGI